ncbi:ATP-binding protein [Streptomyces griseomycini]|uniref:Anti-sigma regulatory factor (Ser/Thr protein kinase) n=1 Tax=Streptomyces griseomycini TaxID=66895 RepID=A0A7W7PU39_9ACTN|nr:ATP-binding protein [Streptomyces griseomycini]MBB4901286.1 anti-sigma regulatory factor (Ser/Thr protein kinase) [Streptomyces griseomycini]GGQ13653.1 ATP-binding protein [Streptomyces griseomycini]GGR23618.1 ATP-binding protein [Streptomyces griseomycini]
MEPVPVDEGATAPGASRLRASYALEGGGAWIAQARHLAAAFLTRARAEDDLPVSTRVVEITQLVVSELVTNARKYAPGPVRLDLRVLDDALEVVVRDGSSVLPVPRAADPGRVGQHGLEIVMAVAQELDVRQEPTGKRVTARISLLDTPAAG